MVFHSAVDTRILFLGEPGCGKRSLLQYYVVRTSEFLASHLNREDTMRKNHFQQQSMLIFQFTV